jgi:preprotein translocase subunit YajC
VITFVLADGLAAQTEPAAGSGLLTLLPLLLLLVIFYFLIMRPARRRQQEALRLQSSLHVGQEVLTTSGLYGRIVGVDDDVLVIEAAPGVRMRWAKGAVARVVGPNPDLDGAPDEVRDYPDRRDEAE